MTKDEIREFLSEARALASRKIEDSADAEAVQIMLGLARVVTDLAAEVERLSGALNAAEAECGDHPAPCNHEPAHERKADQ